MNIQGYRARKEAGKIEIRSLGETALVLQENFSPLTGEKIESDFAQVNPIGLRNDLTAIQEQIKAMQETEKDLLTLIEDVEAAIKK